MKKFILGLLTFILLAIPVSAEEKREVSLHKCVDGDTAWFILDGKEVKARFLAIDSPESTTTVEEYGKEASDYTCSLLTEASVIEIEYDPNSNQVDKYDRHLVWIFIDGILLQEKVIQKGLGEVAYLYGDYKYADDLKKAQEGAKEKQLGIWSEENTEENISYLYIFIVILILIIFSKSIRNKVIRKTKNSIKNQLKKTYKIL